MNSRFCLTWGRIVMLAVLAGLVTLVAGAGINTWTTNEPYGGLIEVVAIDPVTPATVFAGTFGGVFESTDGGGNWTAVNAGMTCRPADALAIDLVAPTMLRAGSRRADVFESSNGGSSRDPISQRLPYISVINLAIDPLAPETVSAGTHGGGAYSIARSTNLTISPTVLPDGFLHVPYSRTITVAGSTRPYTFAVTSGSHPAGLCLSASGDPTGTPAVVGTSSFSVTTTDALGSTATQGYTISVSTAVIPAAERQALIDLYNATGGAGPTVPGWDAAG